MNNEANKFLGKQRNFQYIEVIRKEKEKYDIAKEKKKIQESC